jgi:dihydrodipicolinate synthase/N-acetylneuraminate lyase
VAALAGLGVAGIKDSGTDAARLAAEIITTGVDTYTGTAYLLGLTHDLGGSGALLGLSNSHPELGVKALAGDEAALRSLIERSMGAASNFPGGLKQLAHERWGVPLGSRTPHGRTVMELIES